MALVPIRIPWTSKPPLGTPIDWSNPLTQGLVDAWAFNENGGLIAFGSCSKLNGTVSSPAIINNERYIGTGLTAGSDKVLIKNGGYILGGLNKSTVISLFSTTAISGEGSGQIGNGGNAIYCERATSGPNIYKLCLTSSSGLSLEFTYRNSNNQLLQQRINVTGINDGNTHVGAIVKNGSTHSVYCDGLVSSGTFAGVASFNDSNIQCLVGNDPADINSGWNGYIGLVLLYNIALSINEITSLSANPWQIYQPQVVWIEDTVGGATSFSGTIAAVQWLQSQGLSGLESFKSTAAVTQQTQTQATPSLLSFKGGATHTQQGQSSLATAFLAYIGTIQQQQSIDSEAVAAILSFIGTATQQQVVDLNEIAAVLGFSGGIDQTQAAQYEYIFQSILNITGEVTQSQMVQIMALVAVLGFSGGSVQTQTEQTEEVAATLRFAGASTPAQVAQTEELVSVLRFVGNIAYQQPLNRSAIATVLGFSGILTQTQAMQVEAIYQTLVSVFGACEQTQIVNQETIAALLTFKGIAGQLQPEQRERLANFVATLELNMGFALEDGCWGYSLEDTLNCVVLDPIMTSHTLRRDS